MDWPILSCLRPDERSAVVAAARPRRFARGEVVLRTGDRGDALHLLAKGLAAVQVTTLDGDEVMIGIVGPGEYFGEQALVGDPSRRMASVIAIEPVETLALPRADFDRLRRSHPDVDTMLIAALSQRVTRLAEQLTEALFVPADVRLVRRLDDLASLYRTNGGASTISLTQSQLGALAGTTRPTVNKVLGELARDGIVEVGRGRVTVLDAEGLHDRCR